MTNIDAWQKTHAAWVTAVADALCARGIGSGPGINGLRGRGDFSDSRRDKRQERKSRSRLYLAFSPDGEVAERLKAAVC